MPFVHVRSLPLAAAFDADRAVRAVSSAFARDTGIDERHVTVTWQTLDARSGATPILVDVVAPDFHGEERIATMLRSVAAAVAREAGLRASEVFVDFRAARSGRVLDGGEIVRW